MLAASAPRAAGGLTDIVPINGGMLSGTTVTINAGAGDQFDPHVSDDLVAYSSGTLLRYYRFSTNVDAAIPQPASTFDILSDVSGDLIAFTRISSDRNAIMVFDTTQAASATNPLQVDPQVGSNRLGAAIGGNTVAFVDLTVGNGDIDVWDLATSTKTTLSTTPAVEQNPNVSPDGNTLVWEQCVTSIINCDVMMATRNGGSWIVTPVANSGDPEGNPDSDGTLVVNEADITGNPTGRDIQIRHVANILSNISGGLNLSIAGSQVSPSVSGGLVAFEGGPSAATKSDLFVYGVCTNTVYQPTNTSSVSEFLNDMSVLPNGTAHVVWVATDGPGGEANIYATTFTLPPCESPDTTPPVVTAPAPITIPATGPFGTRGSASPALAAFLAGGSAVDAVDPAPVRLAPRAFGSPVNNTTLFPFGKTTVTFRYKDASNNVGSATSTVTVTRGNDNCHGNEGHGHHEGDGCTPGHHGHFPGDGCRGRRPDGFHHDGDGDNARDVRHVTFLRR